MSEQYATLSLSTYTTGERLRRTNEHYTKTLLEFPQDSYFKATKITYILAPSPES